MTTETEAAAPQQTQNPSLSLTLTLQEVNVIIAALQEIPFKAADPVLKVLVPQAEQQLKAIQQQG
jgi:hypothetical protein